MQGRLEEFCSSKQADSKKVCLRLELRLLNKIFIRKYSLKLVPYSSLEFEFICRTSHQTPNQQENPADDNTKVLDNTTAKLFPQPTEKTVPIKDKATHEKLQITQKDQTEFCSVCSTAKRMIQTSKVRVQTRAIWRFLSFSHSGKFYSPAFSVISIPSIISLLSFSVTSWNGGKLGFIFYAS